MLTPNMNYRNLKESYLFHRIGLKIQNYLKDHPENHLYRMGIGDVSLPLCEAVIRELHSAVADQSRQETFHGYMPECGAPFLRERIAGYYRSRVAALSPEDVFVSGGASDELGDLQDLFDRSCSALIMEPAYPAYVDACVMAGRQIHYLTASEENHFLPMPDSSTQGDLVFLCSPNNPTGAAYSRSQLRDWVDWANAHGSVILFDAAYESFVFEENIPRSIYEIPGAKECAIEISSLSKTAGFTGTRCGYTVIPMDLVRDGLSLNAMWMRNRTTRTNGVSYILQKAAMAVFSEQGQKEVAELHEVYRANAKAFMKALDEAGLYYAGGKNSPTSG